LVGYFVEFSISNQTTSSCPWATREKVRWAAWRDGQVVYAYAIRRYISKHMVVKQIIKIARNIINSNHYISERVGRSLV